MQLGIEFFLFSLLENNYINISCRSPSNIVPQYAPNAHTPNDSFDLHSTNNLNTNQQFQEPRTRRPRSNKTLNAGGDSRY